MKKPGTGYSPPAGARAFWEDGSGKIIASFRIDQGARPWGPDGGPVAADGIASPHAGEPLRLYLLRYAGGGPKPSGWGIGAWGEALGQNIDALERWYATQSAEHQAQWDGIPTAEEVYDAAFTQARNGSFYRGGQGDARETAILIDGPAAWDENRIVLERWWATGKMVSGLNAVMLQGAREPRWYNVLWMPPGLALPPPPPTPPPPAPPPVDPPAPPPPPTEPPAAPAEYVRLEIPPDIALTVQDMADWLPPAAQARRGRLGKLRRWLAREFYVKVGQ